MRCRFRLRNSALSLLYLATLSNFIYRFRSGERCRAGLGISEGPHDFLDCAPDAYPRPCNLEPCLAVVEIDPGPALAAERQSAVGVAFPLPLWDRGLFHERCHMAAIMGGIIARTLYRGNRSGEYPRLRWHVDALTEAEDSKSHQEHHCREREYR